MKYYIFFALFGLIGCQSNGKQEAAEFFKRANYHFGKNDFDKAEVFYSEAIEKVPDFADAYLNRGLLREKLGQWESAETDLKKAVELDADFHLAKLQYARFLSIQGKFQPSQQFLDALPSTYQDSLYFQYVRGKNAAGLNKSDQALAWFAKAEKQSPALPDLLTDIGFVYFQDKDLTKAKVYFQKALQANPQFAMAHHNVSVVFGKEKQFKEALFHSGQATQIQPKEGMFWTNHAYNALLNNNQNLASMALTQAAKMENTNNPYWLRVQGVNAFQQKKFDDALRYFTEAEANDPSTELIYFWLGQTFKALGRKTESCSAYNRGFTLRDGWSEKCR